MIYLHVSFNSVEAVETKKGLFNNSEKIIAASRKIISDKIPVKNLFADKSQYVTAVKDLLKTAYPSEIKDRNVSLVIPDDRVIIKRFTLSGNPDVTKEVIDRAKEFLSHDITQYENFYKEIKSDTKNEVVFTAVGLSEILAIAKPLIKSGLKLNFLSSTAFSVFALLVPIIKKNEKIIYLDINQMLKLVVLDEFGPIYTVEKKTESKNIVSEIKSLVKKTQDLTTIKADRLILAGEKSLEMSVSDIQDENLAVLKMSSLLEEVLKSQKTELDTGGVPIMYFDKVLGLINLSKMADVPNFALDLKNIKDEDGVSDTISDSVSIPEEKQEVADEEISAEKPLESAGEDKIVPPQKVKMEVEVETGAEKIPASQTPSSELGLGQNIIEYRKTGLSALFENRLVLVGLFAAISFIIVGSYLMIAQSQQFSLPFISSPTPTLTVTPIPSITPTPTVDPNLKRDEIKLQVLNGTDKAGFAKSTSEVLEKLGYGNIAVGNADRDDYQKTVIRIKDEAKKYQSLITGDLSADFDTSTVESLPQDSQYDLVIILGQK